VRDKAGQACDHVSIVAASLAFYTCLECTHDFARTHP